MASQLEKTPTLTAWLEDELIPLEQAAIAAYFHLSGSARHLHGEEFLAEVLPLVAAALAVVAPIYAAKEDDKAPVTLSPADIEELLFRASRTGTRPGYERLSIRRSDLMRAVRSLTAARTEAPASGPAPSGGARA